MTTDANKVGRMFLVVGALIIAVFLAVFMVTNPTGGIAALVPMLGIVLSIIAFVSPRSGLFALVPLVIWVDELKRLAVYFGGAYSITVMQTLALPFVVLAALNAGYLVHVLFGKAKIDRIVIVFYLMAIIVALGVFAAMQAEFAEKAQRCANIAGYLTLIPISRNYLRDFDDWKKFFSMQALFAFPAAVWGIKQYYYGFDNIEWTYARSGLSRVHGGQMLMFAKPRVFGFFGSASALGCVAIYTSYSWWHAIRYSKGRFFWISMSAIYTWVIVCSTQRTTLLYPLIVLVFAYMFRTRIRTIGIYVASFWVVMLAILNATYLLDVGIPKINSLIQSNTKWGEEVLNVNTFSDRLFGWERLARARSWTLSGTGRGLQTSAMGNDQMQGGDDANHDIINKVLISYGVIGLTVLVVPIVILLVFFHRIAFKQKSKQAKRDVAFVLGLVLPTVVLSFLGGDNFNANPINIQIWTCFTGALVCGKELMNRRSTSYRSPSDDAQQAVTSEDAIA